MAFIVHHEAFNRLREIGTELPLRPEEKAGGLLNALAPVHAEQVRLAFDSKGASTGTTWAPWSAAYAAWRRKHSLGDLMLRLTDTLYEKATVISHPNFYRNFIEPGTYQFGFMDEVGSWHVTGTKKMPPRSMMNKTEQDVQQFMKAFLEYWINRTKAIIRSRSRL